MARTPRFVVLIQDEKDKEIVEKHYQKMIANSKRLLPQTQVEVLSGNAGIQHVVSDIKDVVGVAFDKRLSNAPDNQYVKITMKVLEMVNMPSYHFNVAHLKGGAMEQRILESQWESFEPSIGRYSPRGLRVHDRQIVHLKVLVKATATTAEYETKSVTFDLSFGGCFIVVFEALHSDQEIFISLDGSEELIRSRVAWNLPWGGSQNHLPGVGLQFLEIPEKTKKVLGKYLLTSGSV